MSLPFPEHSQPETNQYSILLVDDEPANLQVLSDYLNSHGFKITVARSGLRALERVHHTSPDLILLDVAMPGIDGFETCRQLKVLQHAKNIPVIFLTAMTSQEDKVRGFQAGGVDYVTKPIQLEELLVRVQTHLSLRAMREHLEDLVSARTAELVQANRMLRILSECNQVLVRVTDENTLLEKICHNIIELGGYRLAWVGYLEQNAGKAVLPVAQDGFEEFTWSDTEGELGPVVTAIDSGKPSIVNNVHTDPVFAPWRDSALQHGYISVIALPLHDKQHVIGILTIYADQANAFYQAETNLLMELADDLAYGITSLRAQAERIRAEIEREAIYQISQAAISADSPEALYRSIHQTLGTLIPAENFYIALYDPATDAFSFPYFEDQYDDPPALRKAGRGLTEYVFHTGQALLASPEVFASLFSQGKVETHGTTPIDWLGVPLRVESRLIGVMAVQSYAENTRYGKNELSIMEFVSTQVAMIVERKQAEEALHRKLEETSALHIIDKAITSSADLSITLDILLDQALNRLGVDAGDVLILNTNTQALEYAARRGFRATSLQPSAVHIEGHYSHIVTERIPVYVSNLAEVSDKPPQVQQTTNEGFMAYYGVPLIAKGQVKGILEVFHRAPLHVRQEWTDFLMALAAQAAIAIDNSSLFDALQRSNQELTVAYDATLEGWSHALELRDQETQGHTRRVTDWTLHLAKLMGINDAELVHIRRGALLHDIGKMGIPDSILLKPGPLTDAEWEIMRKHPVYAFTMLHPIPYLRPALDIPYRHHEKWDGSGYPGGLKDEQIPRAARIFAVVDVWDALTSDRPYRKAWTKEKTSEYIRSKAGIYFDPKIVDVFLTRV